MTLSMSTVGFAVGLLSGVAVALGFLPVKPWLYVAGVAVVVGFVTE